MPHTSRTCARVCLLLLLAIGATAAQEPTATLRGRIIDAAGAPLAQAAVTLSHAATGVERTATSDADGRFRFVLLPPGEYQLTALAASLPPAARSGIVLEVGAALDVQLVIAPAQDSITVSAETPLVETRNAALSLNTVIDERALADVPLNGRRFTDLALLAPGVTQDPRGLTSGSNGDLAFGGVRGYHSTYLVDGSDNNNGFFAQARGRYRAPYQFSSEVVQEFRVSSNTYAADLGRTSGAVVNVVTKSGTNHLRGSAFYFGRDGRWNARHRFVSFKPPDKQHQFGFTLGGPVRKNKFFFFGGWDQHIFHVPTVVQFVNGSTALVPAATDYEVTDQAAVFDAAARLSTLAGEHRTRLLGNAGFAKADWTLSPRHFLSARLSTSRYSGENNVFFDQASPVTNSAVSENGEERVATESAMVSLTSSLAMRLNNSLRVQFSRDLQESTANAAEVRTRIDGVLDGMGRSSILPRRTREHRLHITDALNFETPRHSWKFGGDFSQTWISNYFPLLFGGQYVFDNIRVNPFTFRPQTFGLAITPLRAYAHGVPRFYSQNFGSAASNPDTREFSLFLQDSMRLGDRVALSLGLRYDRQSFRSDGLVSNPLWPDSGKVPRDGNNFSPRVGFAVSFGSGRAAVLRGGYGLFYTRVPSIYTSAVETENGLNRTHLFLDHADFFDRQLFPAYPAPAVICPPGALTCVAPAALAGRATTQISSFSPDFRTPHVHQASLGFERELGSRFAIGANVLHVSGRNLIRARDVNLPQPVPVRYPIFEEDGATFTGEYFELASFSTWQTSPSLSCLFPPCINPLQRPLASVGAVNVFETAAASDYQGFTLSLRRRMHRGFYFRLGYTWATATDNGQDGLVAGRPALVQNTFAPAAERGRSVTDQAPVHDGVDR